MIALKQKNKFLIILFIFFFRFYVIFCSMNEDELRMILEETKINITKQITSSNEYLFSLREISEEYAILVHINNMDANYVLTPNLTLRGLYWNSNIFHFALLKKPSRDLKKDQMELIQQMKKYMQCDNFSIEELQYQLKLYKNVSQKEDYQTFYATYKIPIPNIEVKKICLLGKLYIVQVLHDFF